MQQEEINIVNTIIDVIENNPSFTKEKIKNHLKRYKIVLGTNEFEKLYKCAKERWMNNQGKIGNTSRANKGIEKEKVIEKMNEGKSQREAAKELGITRSAVQYYLRKEKTMAENKEIQVNHPSHYNTQSYECWDVFKEIAEQNNMSPAESALFFNVFKYVWRYKSKDGVKDIEKAKNYIDELIKILGE